MTFLHFLTEIKEIALGGTASGVLYNFMFKVIITLLGLEGRWRRLDGKVVLAMKARSCAQTRARMCSSRGTKLNWAKPTYLLRSTEAAGW
jgi:hypothetical protein